MSPEQLAEAGFREWPVKAVMDRHDRHWQLRVRDGRGTRFFVNVRFWEHSRHSRPGNVVPDGWDAWAQFGTGGTGPTFNVTLQGVAGMGPPEVVAFCQRVWESLGCSYYEEDAERG